MSANHPIWHYSCCCTLELIERLLSTDPGDLYHEDRPARTGSTNVGRDHEVLGTTRKERGSATKHVQLTIICRWHKSKLADAIPYALTRWTGLSRFLDDGGIEIDSNTVERSIRPLALNRKNALFAGSDDGGDHWVVIASMIETCKLSGINPQIWLADTLTRLAAGHSATALDQLMPWNHATAVT